MMASLPCPSPSHPYMTSLLAKSSFLQSLMTTLQSCSFSSAPCIAIAAVRLCVRSRDLDGAISLSWSCCYLPFVLVLIVLWLLVVFCFIYIRFLTNLDRLRVFIFIYRSFIIVHKHVTRGQSAARSPCVATHYFFCDISM